MDEDRLFELLNILVYDLPPGNPKEHAEYLLGQLQQERALERPRSCSWKAASIHTRACFGCGTLIDQHVDVVGLVLCEKCTTDAPEGDTNGSQDD